MKANKTTILYRLTLTGVVVVLFSAGLAWGAGRPVVDQRVLSRLTAPTDSAAVWIFLSKKDPLGSGLSRVALSTSWISTRSVERRRIKGLPEVTELDRPIAEDAVEKLEHEGLRLRTVCRWFTAVTGWVDRATLEKIAAIDWVDSIRVVQKYRRALEPPVPEQETLPRGLIHDDDGLDYGPSHDQLAQIGVTDAHRTGYTGQGVLIGFLDTGYDPTHPAFASANVIATRDFINGDDDVSDDDLSQMDHGTKSWSACGAFALGELIGSAYEADFALAKTEIVGDEIEIEEDFYAAGLEWFDSLGVDVVSSSLGYPDFYQYEDLDGKTATTTIAVNIAAARGITVSTAAGNEGANKVNPWIIPPSDSEDAIAVGAVIFSGLRWGGSSIGPTADGRIKPDVMARGLSVWLANPSTGGYSAGSGTSFATPLVSGACALILQKYPELMPRDIIDTLHRTSSNATSPDNLMGYGIVNLRKAMNLGSEAGEKLIAGPNPFTETIEFLFPEDTPVEPIHMRVFSVAGKMVFSHEIIGDSYVWGGRNNAGKKLASGVYFCWFKTLTDEYTVKVAYLRQD